MDIIVDDTCHLVRSADDVKPHVEETAEPEPTPTESAVSPELQRSCSCKQTDFFQSSTFEGKKGQVLFILTQLYSFRLFSVNLVMRST